MENQLLKNLKVISPSYKRADLCTSHKLFPKDIFYYAVEESEYDLYKSKGFNCIPLPKRNPQNIASARNCILNQRNSKYITMIDDDCRGFFWRLRRKQTQLSMDDILKFMSIGYQMAEDSVSGLWGINLNNDALAYQTNNPFHFSSPVLGTFSNIIDEDLRYDESITLKEDYDYFLQQMEKYRKVLRFNYLFYVVDHLKLSGGCQTYRTKEEEERQKILLQKKWGSDIVQHNPRKDRNSTNMIIKSPI